MLSLVFAIVSCLPFYALGYIVGNIYLYSYNLYRPLLIDFAKVISIHGVNDLITNHLKLILGIIVIGNALLYFMIFKGEQIDDLQNQLIYWIMNNVHINLISYPINTFICA